jgi:hypothetical protein
MTPRRPSPCPFPGSPCPPPALEPLAPAVIPHDARSAVLAAPPRLLRPDRVTQFMGHYERHLRALVVQPSLGYAFALADVPAVVARMRRAFEADTYSLDGHALRGTCRALGIRSTRQAINAYLQGAPHSGGAT